MNTSRLPVSLLLCMLTFLCSAQTEDLFHGLSFQESLSSAKAKLEPHAEQIRLVQVAVPSFPLAKDGEAHLICQNYTSQNGTIAEVAFTFADDKLVLVQAYGNAVAALTGKRKDTAQTLMGYGAYWKDLVVTKPDEDKVWMLTPEAAHPNLFTWDNPYLPSNGGKARSYEASGKVPEAIKMGGTLDQLRPRLEQLAHFTYERQLNGDDPNAQLQIDCFGIPYAGFQRKFEARFGDGKLNMVWILTGKGEEDRIRQKLVETYGPALYVDEAWEAFHDWQVLLRKDKPEVLLLTPALGTFYKEDYFKQK